MIKLFFLVSVTFLLITPILLADEETKKDSKAKETSEPKPELNELELLATEAIEVHRDAKHKTDMRIILPKTKPASSKPLLEQLPDNIEIYLIRGYISYSCTRISWKKGIVQAERISMAHSWFYNPNGESFVSEKIDVPPESFATTWLTTQVVLAASTEPINPKINENDLELSQLKKLTMSHAHHFLIRICENQNQNFLGTTRGKTYRKDILDFEEIRIHSLYDLVERLFPPLKFRENPLGKTFPLSEWDEFYTNEVKTIPIDLQTKDLPTDSKLRLETALCVLGESGCQAATPLIKTLLDKLSQNENKNYYNASSISAEAERALIKINLLNQWNIKNASTIIHNSEHLNFIRKDLIKWTRKMFFTRNPEAYHQLLSEDLDPNLNSILICETMAELQKCFPGEDLKAIWALIQHTNPEVATKACFLLLENKLEKDTDIKIYETLERLVLDTETTIEPTTEYFHHFAREQALNYLCKNAPISVRLTSDRIRKHLEKPEDGRMVYHLLSGLAILGSSAITEEIIAAYRLSLNRAYTKGTLVACENLRSLGDKESSKKVRLILNEILAGCNKGHSWEPDPLAKYPWIDKDKIADALKTWDVLDNDFQIKTNDNYKR